MTGFAIAGARLHGDEDFFRRRLATADLCGAPAARGSGWEYLAGGPLGNAILFAMVTGMFAAPRLFVILIVPGLLAWRLALSAAEAIFRPKKVFSEERF